MLITPTQDNIQAALRAFLLEVLPSGIEVVAGLDNRVPEPRGENFVVMTPIRFDRLATNYDTYADTVFLGSITGTTLTVTEFVHRETITLGLELFGVDVADDTKIVSQLTGPTGGLGTYLISISQTVAERTLAAGHMSMQQNAEVTVQLDFHGNLTASDNAQIVSTALRDDYGCRFFAAQQAPLNGVSPLHADNPRRMPFVNEAQQNEWRWVLDCCLQANQVVITPMQFARAVAVGLIEVDSHYPP